MALDVVISCYAGGRPLGAAFASSPVVIDWPGYSKPGPKFSHPTWGKPAAALRSGGRLLPNLLARYNLNISEVGRIAAIGFSAGFGGVRELLRSEADRERIDTAIVADSIHLALKAPGKWDATDPINSIAAWASQAEPFVSFMVEAARGRKLWVSSWGDIPTPNASVTSAAEGNATLFRALRDRVPQGPIDLPSSFPSRAGSPAPEAIFGSGSAIGLYYPLGEKPTLAALKASHHRQAQVILPDIWIDLLAPRWSSGAGFVPTSYDPGGAAPSSPTPPPARGAPRTSERIRARDERATIGMVLTLGAGMVWAAIEARHAARR